MTRNSLVDLSKTPELPIWHKRDVLLGTSQPPSAPMRAALHPFPGKPRADMKLLIKGSGIPAMLASSQAQVCRNPQRSRLDRKKRFGRVSASALSGGTGNETAARTKNTGSPDATFYPLEKHLDNRIYRGRRSS